MKRQRRDTFCRGKINSRAIQSARLQGQVDAILAHRTSSLSRTPFHRAFSLCGCLEFEAGEKIGPAHRLQHSAAISAGGRSRAVKIRGIRPFWRLALRLVLRHRQIVAGGRLSQTRRYARYAASRCAQNVAGTPSTRSSWTAVSEVSIALPLMISLMVFLGRPVLSASSACDMPVAVSISTSVSPGGVTASGRYSVRSLSVVCLLNAVDHDDPAFEKLGLTAAGARGQDHLQMPSDLDASEGCRGSRPDVRER